MQDILKALDTLTNDECEAVIDRAEEILQEQVRKVPPEDPAIGMWANRHHADGTDPGLSQFG